MNAEMNDDVNHQYDAVMRAIDYEDIANSRRYQDWLTKIKIHQTPGFEGDFYFMVFEEDGFARIGNCRFIHLFGDDSTIYVDLKDCHTPGKFEYTDEWCLLEWLYYWDRDGTKIKRIYTSR